MDDRVHRKRVVFGWVFVNKRAKNMGFAVKDLLDSYESLPESDKHAFALEIIRRSVAIDLPPLTEDDFVSEAEILFLDLDRREADDEIPG